MRKLSDLRDIQRHAIAEVLAHPEYMLACQMGFGKSIISLTAIRELLDTFQVNHVLVIAPLLVAEEMWPEEIESWEHTNVLDYEVLTGPPERRENRAKRLPEISIINTENVVWLVDFWGDDWPYDALFIDEISRFKNPAKRTKPTKKAVEKLIEQTLAGLPHDMHPEEREKAVARAAKKAPRNPTRFGALCKVRNRIDRVVGLTGTPAPNGLLDVWSPFYLIDKGERLGKTFSAYRSRWFDSDYMGYKYTLKTGAFDQILERISDVTLSLKTGDYIDLPPVVNNVIKVKFPPKIMKAYKKFEKELLWEEHDIEAVNNGVLTGKMLQLCIAKGTEVLCQRGWVPIEQVNSEDKVWDGVEFVSTDGVKYNGYSNVTSCFGVNMTRGHKVLTNHGWQTAEEILDADASERPYRADVWLPDGDVPRGTFQAQDSNVEVPVCLWQGSRAAEHVAEKQESRQAEIVRLPPGGDANRGMGRPRHDTSAPLGDMERHAQSLPQPQGQGLPQLWRTGNRCVRCLVRLFSRILGRHEGRLPGRLDARPEGQQQGLFETELSLDHGSCSAAKHSIQSQDRHPLGGDHRGGGRRAYRAEADNDLRQDIPGLGREGGTETSNEKVQVFDLINCGPRNRFVVRGEEDPLIVHNCNGSIYDEQGEAQEIHTLKLDALDRVIEEANGAPVLVAYSYRFDLEKLRKKYPKAEVVGEAENMQKRWNNGEISILLASPQSAGHGLNLQKGGFITVWYGLCWSLEYYQQLNKRLHRPGQENTVFIHHIIAEGTVDERVMEVLAEKDATQDRLIEATKYVDP